MLVVYRLTSPGRLPLCFPTSCHTLPPFTVNHKYNPQVPMFSRSFQGYMPFFTRQTHTRAGPGDTGMGSRRWSPVSGQSSQPLTEVAVPETHVRFSGQFPARSRLSCRRLGSSCRKKEEPGTLEGGDPKEASSRGDSMPVPQCSEPPRTVGSCGTGQVTLWVACWGHTERPHAQSHRKVTARAVGR